MLNLNRGALLPWIVLASGALSTSALASPAIPWTTPSGSTAFFTYSNGGCDEGLFGEPAWAGATMSFSGAAFGADTVVESAAASTSDRMEVTLSAINGFEFTQLTVVEGGTYDVVDGEVSVSAAIQCIDAANFRFPQADQTLTFDSGAGVWQMTTVIDLTGVPAWTDFTFVLTNVVQASGADARITKTYADIITPEPMSLGCFALGVLVVLRRR